MKELLKSIGIATGWFISIAAGVTFIVCWALAWVQFAVDRYGDFVAYFMPGFLIVYICAIAITHAIRKCKKKISRL